MSALASLCSNNGRGRAGRLGLAALGALLLAWGVQPAPADAQTRQPAPQGQPQQQQQQQQNQGAAAQGRTQKAFDGWMVNCTEAANKTKRCAMTQTRIIAKTKQLLFAWSLTRTPENQIVSVFTTPTGVAVRDGIRVSVDGGEPLLVPFDICGPRACQARTSLDDATFKRLAGGAKASANFVLANKRMIQTEIDLKGFKSAYAYMVEQAK